MSALPVEERELFVRHANLDGRSIARLRVVERGDSCVVEAEVFPRDAPASLAGPYTFGDADQATAFVNDAMESLLFLGCDVHGQ